jgi:GT2 family glycosyltransferase
MLLNPDTALEPHALSTLWKTLEARPEVGAIGPLLVREDGVREASARRFPSFGRTLMQSLMLDRLLVSLPGVDTDLGRHAEQDRVVDWVTGACLMVRREAVEGNRTHPRVGPLDDRIFMFVEDTEWCWRLRAAGWDVLYTPRARVMHHKGSGEGFQEWRYTMNCRGHAYFLRKHRGAVAALVYQAVLVPGLLLRAGIAAAMIPFRRSDGVELGRRLKSYLRLAARILAGRLEHEERTP